MAWDPARALMNKRVAERMLDEDAVGTSFLVIECAGVGQKRAVDVLDNGWRIGIHRRSAAMAGGDEGDRESTESHRAAGRHDADAIFTEAMAARDIGSAA